MRTLNKFKSLVLCFILFQSINIYSKPDIYVIFKYITDTSLTNISWNYESKLLAISDGNDNVLIYSIVDNGFSTTIRREEDEIYVVADIAWSPVQNYLLIANNLTKIWDYPNNQWLDEFEFPSSRQVVFEYRPSSVDWHPQGNSFAITLSVCEGGTPFTPGTRVEIWDVTNSSFSKIPVCVGSAGPSWNPQGTQLAFSRVTLDEGGFIESEEIEVWDMNTHERILTIGELRSPSGLDWSSDGDLIAFTTVMDLNQFIQIRDMIKSKIVSQAGGAFIADYVPLKWHPSENLIVTGGYDGSVRIWDALSGLELIELPVHEDTVNDVSWSPDGSMLASVGRDGRLFIWDVSELRQLGE